MCLFCLGKSDVLQELRKIGGITEKVTAKRDVCCPKLSLHVLACWVYPESNFNFFMPQNLVGIQTSTPNPPQTKNSWLPWSFSIQNFLKIDGWIPVIFLQWIDLQGGPLILAINWRYGAPSKWPYYKFVSSAITTVNKHSNGKSPSWIGNTSSNGGFSMAMLDFRSV